MNRKGGPSLGDMGETGALNVIQRFVAVAGGDLVVGFGDDTAAARFGEGNDLLLLTADMLVEGTHFLPDPAQWESVGRKAIAVNASDMAAMGGRALHALVSVGLPSDFRETFLLDLYRGLRREARRCGAALVGGDTVRAPKPVIHVAMTGRADAHRPLPLRSRCRPGQELYLTGSVGDAAAGLALLTRKALRKFRDEPWARRLIARHRIPTPRLDAGEALAGAFDDLAMIDVSDGVEHEARLLAAASRAGVCLDASALPTSGALRAFCGESGGEPAAYALKGGEDFELLFATAAPEDEVRAALRSRGVRLRVARVGSVASAGRGVNILNAPRRGPRGFEHFRG